MEPTPVLLIDMPRLVREFLKELLTVDGTASLVAECPVGTGLIAAVDASGARVVVLADSYVATAALELAELLAARPATRLISLADDGRRTTLYALRPCKLELGDVSPETLIRMITDESWARGGEQTYLWDIGPE